MPQDLNFVTFGTLTAMIPRFGTWTCENMRIGQGHTIAGNNWWISGKRCSRKAGARRLQCEGCGIAFGTDGSANRFSISLINEPDEQQIARKLVGEYITE